MDWAMFILAFMACSCGVIGMIAAICELIVTRRTYQRRVRRERKEDEEWRS